jgi:hypothetical protein
MDHYRSLRAGIGVRAAGALTQLDRSRFALSAGTVAAPSVSDATYHPHALVPRAPWRELTTQEYQLLCCSQTQPWRHGADIAVFGASELALAPLRRICADCGYYDKPTGLEPQAHPGWNAALVGFVNSLADYRVQGAGLDASALYRTEPRRATVTQTNRDVAGGALTLGLHVDSWEGTPLRQRATVRNRLCVNLGRAPRYFVFINLTLAQTLRAAGRAQSEAHEIVTLLSGHAFMSRFPDYPITRLRLEPDEVYVAPTGNIIHDGAAPSAGEPDVALHLLGFFAPPAQSGQPRTHPKEKMQHVGP